MGGQPLGCCPPQTETPPPTPRPGGGAPGGAAPPHCCDHPQDVPADGREAQSGQTVDRHRTDDGSDDLEDGRRRAEHGGGRPGDRPGRCRDGEHAPCPGVEPGGRDRRPAREPPERERPRQGGRDRVGDRDPHHTAERAHDDADPFDDGAHERVAQQRSGQPARDIGPVTHEREDLEHARHGEQSQDRSGVQPGVPQEQTGQRFGRARDERQAGDNRIAEGELPAAEPLAEALAVMLKAGEDRQRHGRERDPHLVQRRHQQLERAAVHAERRRTESDAHEDVVDVVARVGDQLRAEHVPAEGEEVPDRLPPARQRGPPTTGDHQHEHQCHGLGELLHDEGPIAPARARGDHRDAECDGRRGDIGGGDRGEPHPAHQVSAILRADAVDQEGEGERVNTAAVRAAPIAVFTQNRLLR